MRNLTPDQLAEISGGLTTLCRVWSITRKDGVILRYTDHVKDLTIGGDIYTATNSFTATATQLTANNVAADTEVIVLLNDAGIDGDDVERGLYINAPYALGLVSYSNLAAGIIPLLTGSVFSISTLDKLTATFTLSFDTERINKSICEVYAPSCRAGFGDARCKVDLGPLTTAFTVTSGSAKLVGSTDLDAFPANHFAQGTVLFTSGDNSGVRVEVIASSAGQLFLLLPLPYPPQVGDTASVTRGCTKTVAACTAYGNLANFRGEPYVPGQEGLSI